MHRDPEIARGERARVILDDPLVGEAFGALERACIDEWRRAPARDVDGRERLWLMLKLCERLREHFVGLVESGTLAADRLAQTEKERKFPFFT